MGSAGKLSGDMGGYMDMGALSDDVLNAPADEAEDEAAASLELVIQSEFSFVGSVLQVGVGVFSAH